MGWESRVLFTAAKDFPQSIQTGYSDPNMFPSNGYMAFCEALTEFSNNGDISGSQNGLYRFVGALRRKGRQVGPLRARCSLIYDRSDFSSNTGKQVSLHQAPLSN
jgi:hypothetical protein